VRTTSASSTGSKPGFTSIATLPIFIAKILSGSTWPTSKDNHWDEEVVVFSVDLNLRSQ